MTPHRHFALRRFGRSWSCGQQRDGRGTAWGKPVARFRFLQQPTPKLTPPLFRLAAARGWNQPKDRPRTPSWRIKVAQCFITAASRTLSPCPLLAGCRQGGGCVLGKQLSTMLVDLLRRIPALRFCYSLQLIQAILRTSCVPFSKTVQGHFTKQSLRGSLTLLCWFFCSCTQ